MAVSTQINNDFSEVKLRLQNRFDFDSHEDFGRALEYANKYPHANFVIDFSDVESIDSSALGMLLLLRDALGGDSAKIQIVRCKSDILEEFRIVNFFKMFNIS